MVMTGLWAQSQNAVPSLNVSKAMMSMGDAPGFQRHKWTINGRRVSPVILLEENLFCVLNS